MSETPSSGAEEPKKESEPSASSGDAPEQGERKPRDLGREMSERAAKPGSTQERLGTEADARSSFASATVHAGQAAGGNIINYHYADANVKIGLAPIQEATRAEVNHTFVEPDGFADLMTAITERRVLLLRADPDRGKFFAAQRLLMTTGTLFQVAPETELGTVTAESLTRGAGYILADLPGKAARTLTAFDVERLSSTLEEIDARLVITLVPGRVLASEVAALVRELGEIKDAVEVFHRHLDRLLDDDAVDQVYEDGRLMTLVKEQVRGEPTPNHARLIAQYVAEAHRAGEPLRDTVHDRLTQRGAAAFESWAEGLPDLPTQAMALAVAVLGGEPYETVSAVALNLQRRLEPEKPLATAERARTEALKPVRGPILRALRAHVVPSTVQTWHGSAPTEAVRYRDNSYQTSYLTYFWNEYDQARPHLLAWLRACATHELESVRVRAAVATGVLASRSFDHVRGTVIVPWAKSEEPELWDAAARALLFCVEKPDLKVPVQNLVRAWSADDSVELRATAARCWRIEQDALGWDGALKALEELSDTEDLEVTLAICDSLAEMWEIEGAGLEAPATLLGWLHDRTRRPVARLAFQYAAADLVRRLDEATWPTLLVIAEQDPVRQREIAELWRDAVTAPGLHLSAKDILAEWAYTVEDVPVARRAFARLMHAVKENPRSRKIIDFEAAKWTKGPRKAPLTSAAVLSSRP
ncbi:hypothetical protein FDA94_26620 [Herbidospora galbida]|uniref:HEAT repeat domain-containing protein n=1 Tax=Herbidospora galbida TaxID=2575442 RepID=A0A4U3MC93_9ACTN|nr:hypothetical protein [Herbidospora galbida]TKK85246.1 hypothetical protein FDA94_26620 [Herbidospora galbida]